MICRRMLSLSLIVLMASDITHFACAATVDDAINIANNANNIANNATATAINATSTANNASTVANNANTVANNAAKSASDAVSTAYSASADAMSAVSTANGASSQAASAVSTADNANINAGNALSVSQDALSSGKITSSRVDDNELRLNQQITAQNQRNGYFLQRFNEVDSRFNGIDRRIDKLDKKMSRGFASQSALSGLFQPYGIGNFNTSLSLGGYESDTALAIGGGYRINERVAVKAGVSTNTQNFRGTAYNTAINLEF